MISINQLKSLTECRNRRALKLFKVIVEFTQFREKFVVIRKFNHFDNSYLERIYSMNTGNSYSTMDLYQKFVKQVQNEYKPRLSSVFRQLLKGEI